MPIARKRFGQNFLKDQQIIDQIIAAIAPKQGENLVEIGPGQGALTNHILPLVKKLKAIELDRDLIPLLKVKCEKLGDLTIYQGDVLKFDFQTLTEKNQALRIFGNLPYNISTPLLFHLIDFSNIIQDMHFMLQKEVAERLAATVGQEAYGRLGIMVQYYCEVELLFIVPPSAFVPKPKVQSAFVCLRPHKNLPYPAKDIEKLKTVVKTAFMQRRKTLRNALKNIISEQDLMGLNIDPALRPEEISLAQYVRISDRIFFTEIKENCCFGSMT